jgi:orotidine-5'-phosphate decarboxylase
VLEKPKEPRERIIVPLDVPTEDEMLRLVRVLKGKVGMFKVGFELFTSLGPRAVELIRAEGEKVFLDLKYHDIPNTVAQGVRAAARMGVSMLTVHASGGRSMLEAAARAAREIEDRPAVVAVTVLTSLDAKELSALGLPGNPQDQVILLGRLAAGAQVDGLVASPQEASQLRTNLGPDLLLVTPGVRPAGHAKDDQARVATPGQAVSLGADFLVIGRPITRAPDPASAADAICKEIGT